MVRLEMKNSNTILTEKRQKDQHYLLEKNDKYEYLTGEEILPSNQRQIKEQAKFAYSPLGKAFEKQAEKRVGTMNGLKLLNCKISLKKMF